MLYVREYVDTAGRNPFAKWLRALNVHAAAKVTTALERIAAGNLSSIKTVGGAFSNTGLILTLATAFTSGGIASDLSFCGPGGTKKRQQRDIRQAMVHWEDYQKRKTEEKTRCL